MQSCQIKVTTRPNAKTVMPNNIVHLKRRDFEIASGHLATAFSQDPLLGYFLPEDAAAKQVAMQRLSQAFLTFAQPYGYIYTTVDEPKGVAIWLPPEASQITLSQLWQVVTSGLILAPLQMRWTRMRDFISLIGTQLQLHEQLVPEPHWYLGMLGVSPDCQGQGIGGMLLQPVLEKADQAQVPCYLETTTTAAVRFYQRHGFEVVHQGTYVNRTYWAMKRYPSV
ncbi:MAG: GNAT family N-acetyltransferase [Cyanobacteria bacterium J06632_22]